MNAEFLNALDAIEREKKIQKEVLIKAVEKALTSAFKGNFGATQNVKVTIDRVDGDVKVFAVKTVVETVEDPNLEISLEEAQKIRRVYEPGDIVELEVTPRSFGRIAAQTAKQVVVQRIREAERGMIYNDLIEKEEEILSGVIRRIEKRRVYVELGSSEGVIEPGEQVPNETYDLNERLKVLVLEVKRTNKGLQVMLSRTHPSLVRRLFEMEVPEIQNGTILIKSIAREAGYRTKMAVHSTDGSVEPVGACVGQRGIRVEHVVDELRGEKIDIIKWSADPAEYIANALSPARTLMVYVNEAERAARVIVPDNQLSLAIGKEGQNARLAAKLTGWKIDIKSETQAMNLLEKVHSEEVER